MTVIGIVVLALGLVVAVALTLADPVLLSRINGEHAQGGSGRHIQAPPIAAWEARRAWGAREEGVRAAGREAADTVWDGGVGGGVVPLPARRAEDREPQAA
ncbi:hypothetical protein GCM10010517_20330 [Streptosporangium fragile]|uniref:Uncharacterized protein n=1 Tax=Streptosporangium fragile TaxID=46186 RepID=A0ABN3VUI7_9ACTN